MAVKGTRKKIVPRIEVCPLCMGWGRDKNSICTSCKGKGVSLEMCGVSYYWGRTIKPRAAVVKSTSDTVKVVAKSAAAIFVVLGMLLGVDYAYNSEIGVASLFLERGSAQLFFWIAIGGVLETFIYLERREKACKEIREDDKEFRNIFKGVDSTENLTVDISQYVSPLSMKIIKHALNLAYDRHQLPRPAHIFKSLLLCPRVKQILLRLEINVETLEKDVDNLIDKIPNHKYEIDAFGPSFSESLILSFEESLILGANSIIPETLFLAIIRDEEFGDIFNNLDVRIEDARNTVRWVLKRRAAARSGFKRKRVTVKHRIMNRAWTARITPMLDRFSFDFTDLAQAGLIGNIVDRFNETEACLVILARSTKNNVLLVGESGSGRETIVKAIAKRIVNDNVYPTLRDKRLVVLDAAALVAGSGNNDGALEARIVTILGEIKAAGNIILFIPDIHNLAVAGSAHGFDASEILAPVFAQSAFQVIGSTTYNDYSKNIARRTDFADTFDVVKIEELSAELAIEALSVEANIIEAREEIILTFGAIKKAVELSKRYIMDKLLPGKAVDLLAEAAVLVRTSRGKNAVVRDEDLMELVTHKTGIPVVKVTKNEADHLLKLDDELHERLVGQDEAVHAISRAIRRVRVGLKKEHKPIGTFLFLGPTGVGKTELAKALAECYFGHEKTMLRFDMSEFQTVTSIEKLIGSSTDYNSTGRLTEEVRRHPFSLILFDELEKAHPNVLNIFLQLFDDGRLTDNLGRTVDFSNSIIIATSNVGSAMIQNGLKEGKTIDEIKPDIENMLLEHFRPEFLNRFTAKIIFKPLSREDIVAITKLQISKLSDRLNTAQGIALSINDEALAKLVEAGFSPTYGARNLERIIQEKVENLVAEKFLRGEIKKGSVVVISEKDI